MEKYKNVKGYICDVVCDSPKAEFIRAFNSWFMDEDTERILSVMDENIIWEMVGDETTQGLDEVRKSFIPQKDEVRPGLIEMRVDGILVDGLWGCSFGTMIMGNGELYAFNDVIRFKEGDAIKVDKIKSYIIKLNQS